MLRIYVLFLFLKPFLTACMSQAPKTVQSTYATSFKYIIFIKYCQVFTNHISRLNFSFLFRVVCFGPPFFFFIAKMMLLLDLIYLFIITNLKSQSSILLFHSLISHKKHHINQVLNIIRYTFQVIFCFFFFK